MGDNRESVPESVEPIDQHKIECLVTPQTSHQHSAIIYIQHDSIPQQHLSTHSLTISNVYILIIYIHLL